MAFFSAQKQVRTRQQILNSQNFGCHVSGYAMLSCHTVGHHDYGYGDFVRARYLSSTRSKCEVDLLSDEPALRKQYSMAPEPTEQGLVLTSWDLVQKLNHVYCSHLDQLIADAIEGLENDPLYDQMTKNNHITSVRGLREILRGDFGMQLLLLILKESKFVDDLDLQFSMLRQEFRNIKVLNKNSISDHIFQNLPEDSKQTLRSVQGQVDKSINTMILLNLVEVDTSISKGKMKALTATNRLNEFARSWCFEAARLLKAAATGRYQ